MIDASNGSAATASAKKPASGNYLFVAGGIATFLWLGLLAGYVCHRWTDMAGLEPNALGDFLAGAFAPLAFLWLVLGFFQQGIELRNSGEALWLQGEELRNSVAQQKELVSTTRDQLAFDRDVVARQKIDILRRAQPAFKLNYEGVQGVDGQNSAHQFKLSNTGKDCFDLFLLLDSVGATSIAEAAKYEKDVFPTGKYARVHVWLDNAFSDDLVAVVTYRDGLNHQQVKRFPIILDGGSILIGDEPQELTED